MAYSTGSRKPQGARHCGLLLGELLLDYGVQHVFGVPGGQTLPLYDACYQLAPRLRHVLMRDERNSSYAAVAYARASGHVGVCDGTVGPGATLLTSALAEALNGSTPLLAIVSDIASDWTALVDKGLASQALDQAAMLKPLCKWLAVVPSPTRLPDLLRTAMVKATTGRPGPVALILPEDVFRADAADVQVGWVPEEFGTVPALRPIAEPAAVGAVAQALLEARRPLLVVGGGGLTSGAWQETQALAERLSLPVATTTTGKGILAENHPLAMGVLGATGTGCAREVARQADLLFFVGAKANQNSTFSWTLPRSGQRFLHLDVDADEMGRVFPTEVALVGDARATLAALLAALPAATLDPERAEWARDATALKQQWRREVALAAASAAVPIKPQRVAKELERLLRPEDTLVCDASFASGWAAVFVEQRQAGRQVIFPRGLAGLGFGLPGAIGARVARPDGQVVCLAGDGGFGYSVGELASLAQHGLKVICIVLNNGALSWIKWGQRFNYDERYQSSDLVVVDYARAAEAFGCLGLAVELPDQLAPALERAWAAERAVVLDVRTEQWESPILAHGEQAAAEARARARRPA